MAFVDTARPASPLGLGSLISCTDSVYVALSALVAYEILSLAYSLVSSLSADESLVSQDALYRRLYSESSVEAVVSLAHETNQLFLLAGCGPKEAPAQSSFSLLDPSGAAALHPFARFVDLIFISLDSLYSSADFQILLYSFGQRSGLISPLSLATQVCLSVLALMVFAAVYLSMFSVNREEWQADVDFTISSLSAEAEKELFSVDDATSLCLTLFFFFGVYFGLFLANTLVAYSEILGFALPIPIILFSLVLIPVNLIFDFGLFFVAYLRGASNTSSLFFELVYDYIGVVAFFTRLVVQFVRIVLMVVVYLMMHETVVLAYVPLGAFVSGDSFLDELSYLRPTLGSVTYFFFMALPARLGYWLYEVLHTFFVVTVQFMAFFTIVFWLFLLFYTFFIYESFEDHFSGIRKLRKDLMANINPRY